MRVRFVLVALCAIGPTLGAQAPERAVFLVRQGADTLAVENASRLGARLEGQLILRSPVARIGQEVTLSDSSTVERVVTLVRPGAIGDSVRQRAELTFRGDSAVSHVEDSRAAAPISDHRFAVTRSAIPFVNLSGLSLELILRRARVLRGDTVRVPVILLGGQTVPATVIRVGGDSLLVVLGGVTLRARSDRDGRLLGAAVPSQGLVFERLPGDAPAGRWLPVTASYAAPPGAPYTAQEVRVRTPAGLTLVGTLTLPARRTHVRVPAVVLISGSGPQDRDESSPALPRAYRPFREIADTLARRGIAVLRLDDRGVGTSDAGPPTATSADLADDVRAALAWLRARPEIDSTRLGLVGHSEGGIIAPMVAASDPRVRGLALIAGPASTGRKISEYQIRYLFSRDTTFTRAQRDSLLALALRQSDSAYTTPGWARWIGDYDPLPMARRVQVPALILQGETDRQVPATDAARLAEAMRAAGNRNVTVRTFPRLNHLMLDDPSGDVFGYGALPNYHVRTDLLGALTDWLARTL